MLNVLIISIFVTGFFIQIYKIFQYSSYIKFTDRMLLTLLDFQNIVIDRDFDNEDFRPLHDQLGFSCEKYYFLVGSDRIKLTDLNLKLNINALEFLLRNTPAFVSNISHNNNTMYGINSFIKITDSIDLVLKRAFSKFKDKKKLNILLLFFPPAYFSNVMEYAMKYFTHTFDKRLPRTVYSGLEFISTLGGVISFFILLFEFLK